MQFLIMNPNKILSSSLDTTIKYSNLAQTHNTINHEGSQFHPVVGITNTVKLIMPWCAVIWSHSFSRGAYVRSDAPSSAFAQLFAGDRCERQAAARACERADERVRARARTCERARARLMKHVAVLEILHEPMRHFGPYSSPFPLLFATSKRRFIIEFFTWWNRLRIKLTGLVNEPVCVFQLLQTNCTTFFFLMRNDLNSLQKCTNLISRFTARFKDKLNACRRPPKALLCSVVRSSLRCTAPSHRHTNLLKISFCGISNR